MTRFFAALLAMLAASPAYSDEALIRFAVPGDGQIRLQRLEGAQVISDVFAGFFSDAVVVPQGAYRVQFVKSDQNPPVMAYCDLMVGPSGEVALVSLEAPVMSAVLGNSRVRVAKVAMQFTSSSKNTTLTLAQYPVAGQPTDIQPLIRVTAWTNPQSGAQKVRVKLDTDPGNAEVWFNGTLTEYRTNVEFFVPVGKSSNSVESLLVRRKGYANVMLKLRSDDDPAEFKVKLSKTE